MIAIRCGDFMENDKSGFIPLYALYKEDSYSIIYLRKAGQSADMNMESGGAR